MEKDKEDLKAKIEDDFVQELKLKNDAIMQLKKENEEKSQAILNSRAEMQDTRFNINKWEEKIGEKKKLLDEEREAIKTREIQISCLKEQNQLLAQNSKVNAEITRITEEKMKKEISKLQAMIKLKEKELIETTKKSEEDYIKVKVKNTELINSIQENSKYIGELKAKIHNLEINSPDKENQWYNKAMAWKAEADQFKKEVLRLESERANLFSENDITTAHTNTNHHNQKFKDEVSTLKSSNYKLNEEVKLLKEKIGKSEKDFQYLQAKHKLGHADLVDLPSKYEFRIQELEQKLEKEEAISHELSKLPEVAPIYFKKLAEVTPIEQIAGAIDYLVQTIRVK